MSARNPPRVSPLGENRVGLCVVAHNVISELISQFHPELGSKTYQEAAPSVSDAVALLSVVLFGNDIYRDITIPYTDQAYLTRFLEENTWVQEELRRAWANKDYTKFLQYTFWYDLPEAGDDERTKGTVFNNKVQAKALRVAWKTEYTGVLHKLLYVNIQEAFQETVQEGKRVPFANYACLINGSGSGKSRMISQLASLMFSISINFRRSDSSTRQQMRSYPKPDRAPRDHFLRSRSMSYREQEAFFWTWFIALFQVLSQSIESANIKQQDTYGDLASLWSVTFERARGYMYEDAVQMHRGSGTHINAKQRKALRRELRQALCNLIKQIDGLVKPSARASNLNCVKMVCSFDEADALALAKVPNNGKEGNMFEALCTSLDAFRGLPIFFIFLSTNSNVALLAPPKRMSTSDAARNHFDSLVAPFTETAFDCSPNFPLRRTGHTLKKISTIEFMAQFGRPLWQSMLQGTNKVLEVSKDGDSTQSYSKGKERQEKVDPAAATKELMDLARAKLIGCSDPLDWNEGSGDRDLSDRWSPLARRVLADNRISLGYEPAREKTYGELSTQVASHMRTAFSVPDHREYMRSGYPSEPILAEAAARELSLLKQSNPEKGPTTLPAIAAEALRHDLCSPGERGEVVGRILLTLAYDAAVERNHRVTEQSGPVNYSAGCPLIFFIEELFTSEHAMRILDSFPDNIPIIKKPDGNGNDSDNDNDDNDDGGDDHADVHPAKKTFREVFATAYVHFTHFGRLGDDGGITSLALFAAYLRGQAQMGHPTQSQIDVAIPVVVDIDDICEKNMTVLLVSFKRRLVEGSRAQYNICADSLNVFIYSQGHAFTRRPYIALVMELGVCGRARYVLGPRNVVKPSKGQKEKTLVFQHPAVPSTSTQSPAKVTLGRQKQIQRELRDRKTKKKKPLHPRYNIYAYGCSERVYKVIERSERPIYQVLLANRDLFDEYPRKHVEGSLRGMLRQKPIWYTMIDSYHWIALNDWIVKAMQIEHAIAKKDYVPDDVFAGRDEDILHAVEQQAAASATESAVSDDTLDENGQDRQAEESPDTQALSPVTDTAEAQSSPELDEDFFEEYDVEFPDDEKDAEGNADDEEGNEENENWWQGQWYLHKSERESTDQGVHDWSTWKLKAIGQGDEHPIKSKARHFEMDPFKVEDERVRREVREEENVQDELYLGEILLKSPAESGDDKPSQEESPSREAKKRMDSKKMPMEKRKVNHVDDELPRRKKPKGTNDGDHGGEGSRSRKRFKDKQGSSDDEDN